MSILLLLIALVLASNFLVHAQTPMPYYYRTDQKFSDALKSAVRNHTLAF